MMGTLGETNSDVVWVQEHVWVGNMGVNGPPTTRGVVVSGNRDCWFNVEGVRGGG